MESEYRNESLTLLIVYWVTWKYYNSSSHFFPLTINLSSLILTPHTPSKFPNNTASPFNLQDQILNENLLDSSYCVSNFMYNRRNQKCKEVIWKLLYRYVDPWHLIRKNKLTKEIWLDIGNRNHNYNKNKYGTVYSRYVINKNSAFMW